MTAPAGQLKIENLQLKICNAPALTLRPVASNADRRAIARAQALADDGRTIRPTHIVERNGEVVGYFSLNAIPIVTGWLHNDHVADAEVPALAEQIETEARKAGLQFVFAACTPDCRLANMMADLGYQFAGSVNLHLKPLIHPQPL